MPSPLLRRYMARAHADQHAAVARSRALPAWYAAHRRAFQAQLARRATDPLWFGQALYVQFLGAQIVVLEHALCDDGAETARRYAAAVGRGGWQVLALSKRLCMLARVPSVGAFVRSGRIPVTWTHLLKDLGLASLRRPQRLRLILPALQLMPDVQDALIGSGVGSRVLHVLAQLPPADQRATVGAARQVESMPFPQSLEVELGRRNSVAHAYLTEHTTPGFGDTSG